MGPGNCYMSLQKVIDFIHGHNLFYHSWKLISKSLMCSDVIVLILLLCINIRLLGVFVLCMKMISTVLIYLHISFLSILMKSQL